MANHEFAAKRAFPPRKKRMDYIHIRPKILVQGVEFLLAITDTDYENHLYWAGETVLGMGKETPSLTTRLDLIADLAQQILIYLSYHPHTHIEIVRGFASSENAIYAETLSAFIEKAIFDCNRHELKRSAEINIRILQRFNQTLTQLAILSPSTLLHMKA